MGVSSAYLSQLRELASPWQVVQFAFKDAEKKPIASMNSFTEIPLSSWTFLKACSAMMGLSPEVTSAACVGAAWALANATMNNDATIAATALRTRCFEPGVILPPLLIHSCAARSRGEPPVIGMLSRP